jgi:hypothetical protein
MNSFGITLFNFSLLELPFLGGEGLAVYSVKLNVWRLGVLGICAPSPLTLSSGVAIFDPFSVDCSSSTI